MKKLIEISFNYDDKINDPNVATDMYNKGGLIYLKFLSDTFKILVVRHINFNGTLSKCGIDYHFRKSSNSFWTIPLQTFLQVKKEKSDVVFLQGLKFPLQTIFISFFLKSKCKLIAQHHAEKPFSGIKLLFHKVADSYIDAYIFTAVGNAEEWFNKGIITDASKCYEVLEGSTSFMRQDKKKCRAALGITDENIFIWVGGLTTRKDPITILSGLEQFLKQNGNARLYMIYQEEDLIAQVRSFIENSQLLKRAVVLVGKINHDDLECWFSAADFFVSGSHSESTGYALVESMACGCIPVVTNIPSFRKITGKYGFLFENGKPDSFYRALIAASNIPKEKSASDIAQYFQESLSFRKIAEDITDVCKKLSVI